MRQPDGFATRLPPADRARPSNPRYRRTIGFAEMAVPKKKTSPSRRGMRRA
ncbi:MAG: 50S ribosomal protein L32, partial [Parvularculaceae bacterium]|nr:50S ribosomal protein L32 [Parvularculaceae bacterium]